jgi:hypothetical protein
MTINTTLDLILFTDKKDRDTTTAWIEFFAEPMCATVTDTVAHIKAEYAQAVIDHDATSEAPFPMTFPNYRDNYCKNAERIVSAIGMTDGIVVYGQTMAVLDELRSDGTVTSWNMQTIVKQLKKAAEPSLSNDDDEADEADEASDEADEAVKSQLDVALACLPHLSVDELHLLLMAADAALDIAVQAVKVAA